MTRRNLVIAFVAVLVASAGLILYPASRWAIYGWLRGESFYRGMPTSYWQGDLEPTVFSLQDVEFINLRPTVGDLDDHPLLAGDPASLPVLVEFLKSDNRYTRRIAVEGVRRIGPKAQSARSAIIEILKNEGVTDAGSQPASAAVKNCRDRFFCLLLLEALAAVDGK